MDDRARVDCIANARALAPVIAAAAPRIEANRELDRALTAMNIPHEYQEFPGTHEWPYWTEHVRRTVAFCKTVLSK